MSKFWKNKIKNTKVIADKMGVEEDKIKELINGEREIKGETMDKVLKVIEDEKINEPIRNLEILQWYKDINLKKLREDFGYPSQSEFARKLGLDTSTICRLENKINLSRVTPSLLQVYFFFKNEFNRKTKTGEIKPIKFYEGNIWNWYKNTDLKSLRASKGIKDQRALAKLINASQSCVCSVENHQAKYINKTLVKLYNFYNEKEKVEEPKNEIIKEMVKPMFDEKKEEVKIDPNLDLIEELKEENEKLKRQIYLYEKLIERL